MKRKHSNSMWKGFLFAILWTVSLGLSSQNVNVRGTVTDETGETVIGATIIVEGNATVGTTTDYDGNYVLNNVPSNANLVFSYVGMKTQTVAVDGRTTINVKMASDTEVLDELVVTALGIKRNEKSLSYATQKISGKELTTVPTPNLLSNLAGKTAGMMVSNSSAGVGSSVKVVLRGNRSIYGNNQPLYVIDGTPINSKSFTDGANADGGFGGSIDTGDGLAGLNPEDIENINVLKGASASALYGSQAANGVIMITTKRGTEGKTSISFNSSFQADMPYRTYQFQDKYAMGTEGKSTKSNLQWGAKNDGKDLSNQFIDDFFNTGNLWVNSLSISGGNKVAQNYFSYQNTSGTGIIPNNKYGKHNLAIRTTTSLFDNFIELDGSISLMAQDIDHAPSAPGRYFNPIVGLYLFPEGTTEFAKYRDQFEIFVPEKNLMKSNWRSSDQGINQNPYWLINRYNYDSKIHKAIAKANVTVNFTDYLNLKLRGSYDYTKMKSNRRVNWGVEVITGEPGGRYEVYNDSFMERYADALLNFNKKWDELSVMATLGTSIFDYQFDKTNTRVGLRIPNLFYLNNFSGRPINKEEVEHRQLQALFGTISLGWKDMLYLDLTARNDWASTLPKGNRSYFYPSAGASFVFTELLDRNNNRPTWFNFGKLRASWTQVGNAMPWGKTIVYDALNDAGDIEKNTVAPFTDLKPERSTAYEVGLDLRTLNNRFNLDVAFYKTNTENQYFLVDNASGTGFSKYYINAGIISNTGFETSLNVIPVQTKDFEWSSTLNFTTNKNKVVSLPEQYAKDGLKLTGGGFTYILKAGEEWGEMYMKRVKRDDQGRVIVKENDKGVQELSEMDVETRVGNVMPDFMMGWSNQFSYKGVSLSFQIDGRFGGDAISSTQAFLNKHGRSQESADARDAGGVRVDAVTPDGKAYTKPIDAQVWYNSKEGELAKYSATNIRLREVSLGYNLPQSIFANTKYISGARLSLIGRNLFFLYRDAPFDPEMVLSTTTNSTSNIDNFSIPLSRSIGFSLNINF